MKIKVSEATPLQLDWLVAKCEGIELNNGCYNRLLVEGRMSAGQKMLTPYNPSTNWAQGGPIIDRTGMDLKNKFEPGSKVCMAHMRVKGVKWITGPTPLIAAMRSYVVCKLGSEVDVPEELTGA